MRIHRPILAATTTVTLMVVAIGVTPVVADPPISECDIVGTEGPDELFGSDPSSEVICGLGGNDKITDLIGGDVVYAGPGDDDVSGAAGDVVYGGEGNDSLDAYCHLCGETGSFAPTEIHGGPGNDDIHGGNGSDRLYGDSGNDGLNGRAGSDLLAGGRGSDWMEGGDHGDVLRGGPGRDVLKGERGNDRLYGQRGPDTLWGGRGRDLLVGNNGRDILNAWGGGPDRVDGGPGVDKGSWDGQDRVRSVERRLR